ncbi:MAG: DnaJ domain-containing protein [Fimbriimonadaceae bacterium]
MRDHYKVLQVDPEAEQEVIDAAYRRLAAKYHPDVNPGADTNRRMAEINGAYADIGNPTARAQYDRGRGSSAKSPQGPGPSGAVYVPPPKPRVQIPITKPPRTDDVVLSWRAIMGVILAAAAIIPVFMLIGSVMNPSPYSEAKPAAPSEAGAKLLEVVKRPVSPPVTPYESSPLPVQKQPEPENIIFENIKNPYTGKVERVPLPKGYTDRDLDEVFAFWDEENKQTPKTPFRLANGDTILPDKGPFGRGSLKIINGLGTDAAVKVTTAGSKKAYRYYYIRRGQDFTIPRIAVGSYEVFIRSGTDWGGKSSNSKSKRRFLFNETLATFAGEGATFEFSEEREGNIVHSKQWSLTLHRVAGGNTRQRTIPEDEFGED